jgi:putative Mg2+ transporter-C (MgtC) family protein
MALISTGACMFTALGLEPSFGSRVDPTRIAAGIVTGVGFLGAGAILRQGGDVRGMTTAAEIWVAASLGMAVGFGFYGIAVFATVIVLVVLVGMRPIERRYFKSKQRRHDDPPPPADV